MELMRVAKLRHWLFVGALILPSVYTGFLGSYLFALAFGIVMPLHIFLGKFLLVILYLFIPAVGGVGPLTWGWLNAYEGMAKPETIVACTVAMITMGHIIRSMIGLVCLIPATREIATLSEDKPEPALANE